MSPEAVRSIYAKRAVELIGGQRTDQYGLSSILWLFTVCVVNVLSCNLSFNLIRWGGKLLADIGIYHVYFVLFM